MNAEKLTQRSIDAVRKAQSIAVMQSNTVIEPVHILAGLLKQENGLIPQLLRKMNVDPDILESQTDQKIRGITLIRPAATASLFQLQGKYIPNVSPPDHPEYPTFYRRSHPFF